jgi:hypothetical protein
MATVKSQPSRPGEVAVPSSSTGPGGRVPKIPAPTGHATLRVDRESLPHLRKVFDGAMAKLDQQIELAMTGVRVSPWAGDPVSANAATDFNNRSVDDSDSALNVLRAYQQRLKSASDALQQVAEEYRIVESGNSASFGAQGG